MRASAYPDGTYRQLRRADDGSQWLETEFVPGWICAERLKPLTGGRTEVAELRVFPVRHVPAGRARRPREAGEWSRDQESVPAKGLRARLLRQVKIGHHEEVIDDLLEWIEETHGADEVDRFAEQTGLMKRLRRRPGRRRPVHVYARIAVVYDRLTKHWQTETQPIKALAQQHRISRALARSLVNKARNKGFLTRAPHGQRGLAGGDATEKAYKVLRAWNATHPPPRPGTSTDPTP